MVRPQLHSGAIGRITGAGTVEAGEELLSLPTESLSWPFRGYECAIPPYV